MSADGVRELVPALGVGARTCPSDAHAGASSTVSPGRASRAARATTASITGTGPVSATSTSTTGTWVACRARASRISAQVAPVSARRRADRGACSATRSSKVAPWPGRRPPTPRSRTRTAPAAARAGGGLGVVHPGDAVLHAAIQGDPVRAPGRTVSQTRPAPRPGDADGAGQRGRRERVGDLVRGGRPRPEATPRRPPTRARPPRSPRSATNARSHSTSSTTPSIDGAGTPRVKPISRRTLDHPRAPGPAARSAGPRRCRRRPPRCRRTPAPCPARRPPASRASPGGPGHVEAAPGQRAQRERPVQLEAGQAPPRSPRRGWGCSTASSSGVPTLPAAVRHGTPAAPSIAGEHPDGRVLPFVPVQRQPRGGVPAGGASARRARPRPQTGDPPPAACTSSGAAATSRAR
jgi:hypothetical protein